jgi:ubiquinone/menaquinone biosynthesis C-methylase UbiE
MITTICFVDDIFRSFKEAYRILKDSGVLIIGFIDKNSPLGIKYSENKKKSVFYKDACFYGTGELYGILKNTGFEIENTYQTVFGKLDEINNLQEVFTGYGQGSFVVIKAKKG